MQNFVVERIESVSAKSYPCDESAGMLSGMSNSDPAIIPIQSSSPGLQGERVAFTGTLASMTHQAAYDLVEEHGGTASRHVGRNTTMLVVGEEGWPLESDGEPSQKLQQAVQSTTDGHDVRVISESDWLSLVGLTEQSDRIHRAYTPAMLSTLLDVPVGLIRRWERIGLIRPVRKVGRLSYFSYSDVTSARRLSELAAAGVSMREIETSLCRLGQLLGGMDRPLSQLQILASGTRVAYRDDAGLVQASSGQRLLDFDPPESNSDDEAEPAALPFLASSHSGPDNRPARRAAEDWFEEGCRLADAHELDAAIDAFRNCLAADGGLCRHDSGEVLPIDEFFNEVNESSSRERLHAAEVNFHLAEVLYRAGRADAAIERYYVTVEHDANYLEAWTQLGCVLSECQRDDDALDAFEIALDIHPDYPDAHFHIAGLLDRIGRSDDAEYHWCRYLEFDAHGPWAEQARQRISTTS